MHAKKLVALAIAAASLAGCNGESGSKAGVYDLPMAEVYQRLVNSRMPEMVKFRQCGIPVNVVPVQPEGWKLRWRALSDGRLVGNFDAVLTQVSANQTKVEIVLPPKEDGSGEIYDGSEEYTRPAFNQPLRPAIEEQVAMILENRPFNEERVGLGTDGTCNVQRGSMEMGVKFKLDDDDIVKRKFDECQSKNKHREKQADCHALTL